MEPGAADSVPVHALGDAPLVASGMAPLVALTAVITGGLKASGDTGRMMMPC